MFIVALFIATENWKQPRCPSTNEYPDRQSVVHPYNGILPRSKKEWTTEHIWILSKHINFV